MRSRRLLLSVATIALVSAVGWHCLAQYEVEPGPQVPRVSYRVRVINEMSRDVCVKIIPYGRTTFFHADLGRGQSVVQDLYAGQRVLCVWDDRTGDLLIAGGVLINRNGVLRIRPLFADRASAAPGERPKAAAAVPMMELQPE